MSWSPLSGLRYCLHLPASLLDIVDVDAWKPKAAQNLRLDHHIVPVPIDMFDEDLLGRQLRHHHPVIAVCPDE
ncbi:hypothetical protein AB0B79_12630 [Streptomyces sp. NPDC039022]|uniref:hypothetical protein n=1 Tax=Streptomyces sp. NPDC039022 TaxID=3157091 RepID=UPI0033F5A603